MNEVEMKIHSKLLDYVKNSVGSSLLWVQYTSLLGQ